MKTLGKERMFHMTNKKATRESYGEALAFLSYENKDIVVLDADLSKSTKTELPGKHAVIVGASNIVGKPLAMLLMREMATVTVCNIYTKNLAELCRQGDIVISAAGKADLITKEHVKPGAIVIDVGINFKDKKLVGDVSYDEVAEVAGWITPVPGGVGPMTVTMLMFNTYAAAIEGKEINK